MCNHCVFWLQVRILRQRMIRWGSLALTAFRDYNKYPSFIGLVFLLQIQTSSTHRPTPQCIDLCHFHTNPDGIIAGREDLLVPTERKLSMLRRATLHTKPSPFSLSHSFPSTITQMVHCRRWTYGMSQIAWIEHELPRKITLFSSHCLPPWFQCYFLVCETVYIS